MLVCIALRIVYIALKRGPLVEFFKLLAVIAATFVALHYYPKLAAIFYKTVAVSRATNDALAFFILWAAVAIVFKLLREGVLLFQGKKEDKAPTQQWLSFILGLIRSGLVCSLLSVAILLSGNKALAKSTSQSRSVPALAKVAVQIYQGLYDSLVKRFFSSEEFNEKVLLLLEQDKIK